MDSVPGVLLDGCAVKHFSFADLRPRSRKVFGYVNGFERGGEDTASDTPANRTNLCVANNLASFARLKKLSVVSKLAPF